MRRRYRAFGLAVESDLPLPGAIEVSFDRPELTIAQGPVEDGSGRVDGPYTQAGDGLIFTMPGVGKYRSDASGSRLIVAPEPESDPDMVVAMLLATALPMALWLRGQILLHAAAMVLPGCNRAIAFAGPSGAGKSTLLRQFPDARLVSDDVLAICENGHCGGLPGGTWRREQGDRRSFQAVAPVRQLPQAELGSIVVLQQGEGGLERLPGTAAFQQILGNLHRPRVPRMMGRMPALLPRLAALARSIPVYSLKSNIVEPAHFQLPPHVAEELRNLADGVQEIFI